jgi:hypothetical protein
MKKKAPLFTRWLQGPEHTSMTYCGKGGEKEKRESGEGNDGEKKKKS